MIMSRYNSFGDDTPIYIHRDTPGFCVVLILYFEKKLSLFHLL